MTKKHFVSIAQALASAKPEEPDSSDLDAHTHYASRFAAWRASCLAVAGACSTHNPAFCRHTFTKACGLPNE